jgi:hypothetical protein
MSTEEIISFSDIDELIFKGTGKVEVSADGTIKNAFSCEKERSALVVNCGEDDGSGVVISNFGSVTNFASGGSFVGQRNIVVGSGGGRGFSMSNGVVSWGDETSVKKRSFGLEVKIPISKQIEINGARYNVQDIVNGSFGNQSKVEEEKKKKIKIYRIESGCITQIYSNGNSTVFVRRFPFLTKSDLRVMTSGDSKVYFEKDFAVANFRGGAVGDSSIGDTNGISVRTAKLNARGDSFITGINCLGELVAQASGDAKIVARVADRNLSEEKVGGDATCSITRLGEDGILKTTLCLSLLDEGSPKPKTDVDGSSQNTANKRKHDSLDDDAKKKIKSEQ